MPPSHWARLCLDQHYPSSPSKGFLCIFLQKVKGNKARAALQPPSDFTAPSTAQSTAFALPSWVLLPAWGISPEWRRECTFGSSLLSSEVLLGTFGFKQRIATTRANIKSFKQTQKYRMKRLILSFPVLRQYSLSLMFYWPFYTSWDWGKWVEDVEILLHLPAPFLSPESYTQNILLFS